MHKRKLSILLALVLMASCTGKPSTNPSIDPLRQARIQTGIALDSVTAGITATIALQKEGLITADEDRAVLGVLAKVNGGAVVINKRLQGLAVLDVGSRSELLTILSQTLAGLQDANSSGLLGVKNVAAKQRLDGILSSITLALNTLRPIFGGN